MPAGAAPAAAAASERGAACNARAKERTAGEDVLHVISCSPFEDRRPSDGRRQLKWRNSRPASRPQVKAFRSQDFPLPFGRKKRLLTTLFPFPRLPRPRPQTVPDAALSEATRVHNTTFSIEVNDLAHAAILRGTLLSETTSLPSKPASYMQVSPSFPRSVPLSDGRFIPKSIVFMHDEWKADSRFLRS